MVTSFARRSVESFSMKKRSFLTFKEVLLLVDVEVAVTVKIPFLSIFNLTSTSSLPCGATGIHSKTNSPRFSFSDANECSPGKITKSILLHLSAQLRLSLKCHKGWDDFWK